MDVENFDYEVDGLGEGAYGRGSGSAGQGDGNNANRADGHSSHGRPQRQNVVVNLDDEPDAEVADDDLEVIGIGMDPNAALAAMAASNGLRTRSQRLKQQKVNEGNVTAYIDLTKDEDDSDDDYEADSDEDMAEVSPAVGRNRTDSEVQEVPQGLQDGDGDDEMPELLDVKIVSKKDIAEQNKKEGNDHFKRGEYNQAIQCYSKAIESDPSESSYFGNRGASYMMLKKFHEANHDTRIAVQMDPTYHKGYLRLIRIALALGDVKECENAINVALSRSLPAATVADINDEKARLPHLKQFLKDIAVSRDKQDFRRVLFLCERAMEYATADEKLKIEKANALYKLGRFVEASEVCTEVLQVNVHCIDAIMIRSKCHFQSDNIDKSMQFLRQGLQFAPDSTVCMALYKKMKHVKESRDKAATLFKADKFVEAKSIYLELIATVASGELVNKCLESKLQFNLALLGHKQKNFTDAVNRATKAIEIDPNYLKAYLQRANSYTAQEMYDEAVRDYEAALKLDPSNRNLKQELQNLKFEAKKAKRKDYYKILDVGKNASEEEIRKAYKKRALLHHPDRHASATDEVKKQQEKNFKDLGEAYEVLSDKLKRSRYDQGLDISGNSDYGCASNSPYEEHAHIFNMFFGAGGGMPSYTTRPGATRHQYTPTGRSTGGTYGYHR